MLGWAQVCTDLFQRASAILGYDLLKLCNEVGRTACRDLTPSRHACPGTQHLRLCVPISGSERGPAADRLLAAGCAHHVPCVCREVASAQRESRQATTPCKVLTCTSTSSSCISPDCFCGAELLEAYFCAITVTLWMLPGKSWQSQG